MNNYTILVFFKEIPAKPIKTKFLTKAEVIAAIKVLFEVYPNAEYIDLFNHTEINSAYVATFARGELNE